MIFFGNFWCNKGMDVYSVDNYFGFFELFDGIVVCVEFGEFFKEVCLMVVGFVFDLSGVEGENGDLFFVLYDFLFCVYEIVGDEFLVL